MRTRIPTLLLGTFVTFFLLLARPGGATARTAWSLSDSASGLLRYLPATDELPDGARMAGAPREVTNEAAAAEDPDQAALIRANGRITEVRQAASRSAGSGSLNFSVTLFTTAEGAWEDALSSLAPAGDEVERVLPGPDVGERSVLFHLHDGFAPNRREIFELVFQRDRLEIGVNVTGPEGTVAVEETLAVARHIDSRAQQAPPLPATDDELALIEEPTPAVLVRGAVRLLLSRYVEPLDAAQLLSEAWQGAAQALAERGVAAPPAPEFPAEPEAAIALHMQAFPELERLAEGSLSGDDLATAALRALVRPRNDCHTYRLTAEQWPRYKAEVAGEAVVMIGITYAVRDGELRLTAVAPGSPAEAAGLRRGQRILAINGVDIDEPSVPVIRTMIDPREGAPTTLTVRDPSGRTRDVTVAPARFQPPAIEARVLPDGIGLARFDGFLSGPAQVDQLRQALTDFEAGGVAGWILDLRANPGGSRATLSAIASLFLSGGRLYATVRRDEPPRFFSASGESLPFQRPLVVLVGPDSASAAEILAGALQARGRAVVVGEQTAGCVGSVRPAGLLDGSAFFVTEFEIVIGPDAVRAHRIGITPNVRIPAPTPDDDEAGRDPQLDGARAVLAALTGPATPAGAAP